MDQIPDLELGRDPERQTSSGDRRGKLGFAGVSTTSTGTSPVPGAGAQIGLYRGKVTRGLEAEALAADGHVGKWADEDDAKGKRVGVDVGGTTLGAKVKTKKLKRLTGGSTVSADAEALSARATATFNRKAGLEIGAQANLAQGSATIGNPDKTFLRAGGGAGEGAGFRLHWGKNKSGDRQLAVGVDAGPVSIDVGATHLPKWARKAAAGIKRGGQQVARAGRSALQAITSSPATAPSIAPAIDSDDEGEDSASYQLLDEESSGQGND